MSPKFDNLKLSGEESFSDLEDRLERQVDDETVLTEIHVAIKELLSNSGTTEARIREILQKRYHAGQLRPESFELVQKMLDHIRSENSAGANDGFSTQVLDQKQPAREDPAYAKTLVLGSGVRVDNLNDDEQFASTEVIGDDLPVGKPMATQAQVGTILRDRFLLQQQVFGGYTGVVYKALDQRLAEAGDDGNFVAIKVLPEEVARNEKALRALQQEVAKGRSLHHPNIVRCIDLDREGEVHFIVMEWLEGKSLASILDDSGSNTIEIDTAMDIVRQVSLALDYAHQRGVIHGDVNPGNIRITRDGEVKLFDFGIARVMQKEQDRQPGFDPRELGGKSPEYSSMQVLTGESPVPADDVFSLGCLVYRLIAGDRVFGRRSAAEAAAEGVEPQRPQGLTNKQWQALRRALAYSRVPRYKSPAEFMAAFGQIAGVPPAGQVQTQPAVPPPAPQAPRAPQPPRVQAPPPATPAKRPNPVAPARQAAPPPVARTTGAGPARQASRPLATSPGTNAPPQAAQQLRASPTSRAAHEEMQPLSASRTTHVATAVPGPRAKRPPKIIVPDEPMAGRHYDIEPRRSPWRLVVLGIILVASVYAAIQQDLFRYAEQLLADLTVSMSGNIGADAKRQSPEIVVPQPERATPAADTATGQQTADLPANDERIADEAAATAVDAEIRTDVTVADETAADATSQDAPSADAVIPEVTTADAAAAGDARAGESQEDASAETAVNSVALPPADVTIGLVATGQAVPQIDLALRENARMLSIDLVRMHNVREPYSVLLEEVGFSGNRSPWEEGQYVILNNGVATFEAGSDRVRTGISMRSDTLREADRQVTIQVREIDDAGSELARINLRLEDDDRRAYEASLPLNTIAFAAGEVFVSEADPAVQIDVVRFKPDSTPVEAAYRLIDVTTTAGQDYFPPGLPLIYFSPGQRSARILIPLAQDADVEGSEVFALEFVDASPHVDPEIYQRIAVMIRDDD